VAAAYILRRAIDPLWGDKLPFSLFFLAVIVVSQYGGIGPTVFAMIAGFLVADWAFIEPRHSMLMSDPLYQFNALAYFVVNILVLFISQHTRRALAHERGAKAALAKLTAIIDSSDDAIVGKSIDGKIISWNPGAERLYGYKAAEIMGQTGDILELAERRKELGPLQERVARGEHISHFETTRLRKDGTEVEVSLSICPIQDGAGKIIGISTIARDITASKRAEKERERLLRELQQEVADRKEAQRALQETQEMTLRQERLAAVGRLAAGLAHEFNNILTIVQGHASLLLDNPNMDEDSVKSVTHITEGVERTAALVKQMLAFSRKQVMQQNVIHLREITDPITDVLERLLGAHVTLRFEVAPHLPPIVADAEMLKQILVNLTVNARDAMLKGGTLTIAAREVNFSENDRAGKPDRRPGHFVRISVADTGSGIDAETIKHLFEPFFTTKDVGKGTGLGLATVHGMVSQNSGWIEVESAVGKGTTFHIYFPAVNKIEDKDQRSGRLPSSSRGTGQTVLVVEDDAVLRELVQDILESQGYRVLSASTAREALQLWESHSDAIQLVLTDMSMPDGMSGKDLATKLQEQNPRLPVIFSSGYSREALIDREQADQDTTFLSKPYHPADLANIVRNALESAAEGKTSVAGPKS
jgi:PAS domain S-box-containing protein